MYCVLKKFLLVLCFFYISVSQAANGDFNRLFVFGDSLSDTNNLASTAQVPFLSGSPYADGRFSNGPLAVELLAASLGLELKPSLHLTGQFTGTNFAVAGARAGGLDPIDMMTQVGAAMSLNPTGFTPDDLFVVFFGGNDIRGTRTIASNRESVPILRDAANKISQAIALLMSAGAENFMVINAPNIGLIPETQLAARSDPSLTRKLSIRSRVFNRFLKRAILKLRKSTDAQIVPVNLFGFLKFLNSNGEDLGYENVTDACFIQTGPLTTDQIMNPNCDFDEFLFFDTIHPTSVTHARAAKFLEAALPQGKKVED